MAVIKMVKNPPKSKRSLKKAINYITQPAKTNPELVGGLNCDWERAYDEFIDTKAEFEKEEGIQAKHMIMSFDVRDDLTVELAKQIADEFLQQTMFDGFQVVYAVHRDREHIHTHFLINSVNMDNGKRWHQTSTDLTNLKLKSNELCRKYGLSEIELNQSKGNETEVEYRSRFESWKYELYLAAVNSARRSVSVEDFKSLMKSVGYDVKWEKDKKYITFTTPEGKKCRNRKLYPKYKFTKEALQTMFAHNVKKYNVAEIEHYQQILINKVKGQEDKKYPFSSLLESEENLESMTYQEWYSNNREYLLNDDKFDVYKCIGYAMKYASDENDFKERLKHMQLDVEFDTEANVCVFISKQGVEYSNYEMPEVEKYSPENLKKVFDVNKSRSEDIKKEISDKQELRNVIYQVRRYATSKEDFIKKMKVLGYEVAWNTHDKQIVFTTPEGNSFDTVVDLKPPEVFSSDVLEKHFSQNNLNNDFDVICDFLHIFVSGDSTPVTTSMSLVGSELTGEKLREFMYHFERGTASIYNRNLENDFTM